MNHPALGKEVTIIFDDGGKEGAQPFKAKCFVAGIDREIGITIKPFSMPSFIRKLSIFTGTPVQELEEILKPPKDYAVCIVMGGRYDISYGMSYSELFDRLEKLLLEKEEISLTEIAKANGAGTLSDCGFA